MNKLCLNLAKNISVFLLLSVLFISGSASISHAKMIDMDVAVLRSLDKISARTSTFKVPVGKTVKFGDSLFIKVQACRKASPIDTPESASFLQIWENTLKTKKPEWVFSGWMFASSPALSAMDHPVFDVWVMDCVTAEKTKILSETSDDALEPDHKDTEKPEASTGNADAEKTIEKTDN